MKKILAAALLVATITLTSCTRSSRQKLASTVVNDGYKIEMYSGGKLVKQWISTGKVHSSKDSDGYYFEDEATGLLVEVSGDVVITELK